MKSAAASEMKAGGGARRVGGGAGWGRGGGSDGGRKAVSCGTNGWLIRVEMSLAEEGALREETE